MAADIKQSITLVHCFELHLGSSKQIQTSEFIFFQGFLPKYFKVKALKLCFLSREVGKVLVYHISLNTPSLRDDHTNMKHLLLCCQSPGKQQE